MPEGAPRNFQGCVAEFLGPDIVNNPITQGMILGAEERERLDMPFTLDKLDKVLDKANMSSAPGIDGVSNKMIKKIWHWVRKPLLRYAECCFAKGKLTTTFKTACIRLIPKKGNTRLLKNWRPISLLSCYYKVISRVINTRLGTVIDKVTSRSQKAYNGKRHIHGVLINMAGNIAFCKERQVPGAIISIDQTKAFDSIYHGFCEVAYRFFGFGECFIGMMTTLGTGRNARVFLENGELSDEIKLDRGRPQGDSPSPRQYNIGEQVCLLKIELDPGIISVTDMQPLELPLPEHLAGAEVEVQLGTNKSEAFADDTNVTCKQDRNCVLALKNILINFSRISGLQCNLEKTCIVFIGPRNEAEIAAISQLGFTIVNSLKVLGCLVESDGINEETNFDTVIGKINQSAALWSRFNLSIKGRIAISKTMFVSHITYLGAILTPTPGQIKRMEDIIVNFVLRGTPFARDRLYAHPEKGGLGLVQIERMLTSLKCSWLERILRDGVNNTWRADLIVIGGHCFQNLREDSVHEFTNPLLQNIVQSYWIMALAWWKLNNNFMMAPLLRNPIFTRGRNPAGGFDNRAIDSTVVG